MRYVWKLFEYLFNQLQKTLALDAIDDNKNKVFQKELVLNLDWLKMYSNIIFHSLNKLKIKYSDNHIPDPLVIDTLN